MSITRTIRSALMRRIADSRLREQRRIKAEAARRRQSRPHEVRYFHQPDDPYSHLAAQALQPFVERYDVQLLPHVVERPTPIAIHEQTLWDAWARRDCAAMAPYYGLQCRDGGRQPDATLTDVARRVLLNAETSATFAQLAVHAGQHCRPAIAAPSSTSPRRTAWRANRRRRHA